MVMKLKLNHPLFSFFWKKWKILDLFFKILNFEKIYIQKPSLAYLLSSCISSFLKFLAVWEELADKKLLDPLHTLSPHPVLEFYTCGTRTMGYHIENEWHLITDLLLRSPYLLQPRSRSFHPIPPLNPIL